MSNDIERLKEEENEEEFLYNIALKAYNGNVREALRHVCEEIQENMCEDSLETLIKAITLKDIEKRHYLYIQ